MADELVTPEAPPVADAGTAPPPPAAPPPFDGKAIALVYVPGAGVADVPARDLTAAEVQLWGAAFDWAAYLTAGLYTPGPAWPVPRAAAKE